MRERTRSEGRKGQGAKPLSARLLQGDPPAREDRAGAARRADGHQEALIKPELVNKIKSALSETRNRLQGLKTTNRNIKR